jgi:proton-dependent oligopeptide transporter, POT family
LSTQESTLSRIRTGFSPTFWIANTLELFERFAFYGSKAVLSFYLANKIGLDLPSVGWLIGMFAGLTWSLPIIAGVFVDRYGFRKTLAACFFFFTFGYFMIGLGGMPAGQEIVNSVGKTTYMALVLIVTAAGGSLIKPCIVGTVERTSHPDYRALGFSIYYALVNFGGAMGPILASEIRADIGIEWVFVMSAAVSALLMGGTLLFFREPGGGEAQASQRTFGKVFSDMLLVFRNVRFVAFLVIFSGFWMMFWQVFYSLPFYIDEVLHFKRFEILETVDAWTIILLSVPLTALAKKMRAMNAMIIGFVIASASWLVMAWSPTVPAAIAALMLFAVGESLQAPRFYEYVGGLAPRQQVGTFMGFAFLPIAIGSFVAGRLGTWLVEHFLRESQRPAMMWLIVAAIGFVSTLLLWVYDRVVGPQDAATS